MRPKQAVNGRRAAMSMIELIAATAVMAVLMTSVVVVVRSSYGVWNAYEQDIDISENAYGVLRHVIRQLRQADAITAISAAADASGGLSYTTADGATRSWSHNGGQVFYNNGSGDQLLAQSIDELTFVGYDAAGNQTTVPDEIQRVKCTAEVTLTQGSGAPKTVSATAWIRSW
jgi:type II secretory pathway pseudopilin PulG